MKADDASGHRLVLVCWWDSHQRTGWTFDDPAKYPLQCFSMGWLVHDGKEAITVAAHLAYSDDGRQRTGEMTIPKCAIESIDDLMVQKDEQAQVESKLKGAS